MNRKTNPFGGTSKIGEIRATTTQLVQALGYPTFSNDDIPGGFDRDTLYEWALRTSVGPITIYDWKEWEDPDFAEDKVITWQIGGRAHSYKRKPVHPALTFIKKATGFNVQQTLCDVHHGGIRQQQEVQS
ncbi:hypothetical protein N9T35_00100 [bacterium]|nr:hypothetical protein [bacterium]